MRAGEAAIDNQATIVRKRTSECGLVCGMRRLFVGARSLSTTGRAKRAAAGTSALTAARCLSDDFGIGLVGTASGVIEGHARHRCTVSTRASAFLLDYASGAHPQEDAADTRPRAPEVRPCAN